MLTPGTRLDRYELIAPLGEGGQGSVWRARDPLDPTAARAVKLVRLALSRPTDAERVRREARALARLRHPSLVRCHALFEDLGHEVIGLVLDHVDGITLAEAVRSGRLTPGTIGLLLRHVAHALGYVHAQGLAHRDLKLTNVVVSQAFFQRPEDPSTVKLLDFGIATVEGDADRLTALGAVIGTPAYLAPELLDPRAFGEGARLATADVFGFGVLGHRLLTGRHPTGLDPQASAVDFAQAYREARASAAPFPAAPAPGAFSAVLGECLALDPADRIPSGEELARRCDAALGPALEHVRAAEAALAREPSGEPPAAAGPTSGPTLPLAPTPPLPPAAPAPAAATPVFLPAAAPDPRTLTSGAGHGRGGAPAPASAPPGGSGTGWMVTGVLVLVGGLASVLWAAGALRGPDPPAPLAGPPAPRSGTLGAPVPARSLRGLPSASATASAAGSASAAPAASATASASAAPSALPPEDAGVEAGLAQPPPLVPAVDRPPGCAPEAELCACCGTGLTCGGPCTAAFPVDEPIAVRPIALLSGQTDLLRQERAFQVCLRPGGEPVLKWACTVAADILSDSLPPPFLSATAGMLARRGLDVEVRGRDGVVLAQGQALAFDAGSRLARCEGVRVTGLSTALLIDALVLALDVPGEAPRRCPRQNGDTP